MVSVQLTVLLLGLPRDVFSLATGGSGDADADDSSDSVSSRDSDSSDDEDDDTCNSNAKRLKLNERSSDEDIKAFRHRLQIRVKGSRIPPPIVEFKEAKLPEDTLSAVLRNIEEGKWKEPTPIQMQAIPAMTAGRDVLASAPTVRILNRHHLWFDIALGFWKDGCFRIACIRISIPVA